MSDTTDIAPQSQDASAAAGTLTPAPAVSADGAGADRASAPAAKTRRRAGMLPVERAVDARKRRLLARAAGRYRRVMGVSGEPYRYDVVTVLLDESSAPLVRLRRAYFSDRTARP